jgi:hypothetical protein
MVNKKPIEPTLEEESDGEIKIKVSGSGSESVPKKTVPETRHKSDGTMDRNLR